MFFPACQRKDEQKPVFPDVSHLFTLGVNIRALKDSQPYLMSVGFKGTFLLS